MFALEHFPVFHCTLAEPMLLFWLCFHTELWAKIQFCCLSSSQTLLRAILCITKLCNIHKTTNTGQMQGNSGEIAFWKRLNLFVCSEIQNTSEDKEGAWKSFWMQIRSQMQFLQAKFLFRSSKHMSCHFITLLWFAFLSIFLFISTFSSFIFNHPKQLCRRLQSFRQQNSITVGKKKSPNREKVCLCVCAPERVRSPEAKQWLYSTHHQLPMDLAAITIDKFYTERDSQRKLSVFLQAIQCTTYWRTTLKISWPSPSQADVFYFCSSTHTVSL